MTEDKSSLKFAVTLHEDIRYLPPNTLENGACFSPCSQLSNDTETTSDHQILGCNVSKYNFTAPYKQLSDNGNVSSNIQQAFGSSASSCGRGSPSKCFQPQNCIKATLNMLPIGSNAYGSFFVRPRLEPNNNSDLTNKNSSSSCEYERNHSVKSSLEFNNDLKVGSSILPLGSTEKGSYYFKPLKQQNGASDMQPLGSDERGYVFFRPMQLNDPTDSKMNRQLSGCDVRESDFSVYKFESHQQISNMEDIASDIVTLGSNAHGSFFLKPFRQQNNKLGNILNEKIKCSDTHIEDVPTRWTPNTNIASKILTDISKRYINDISCRSHVERNIAAGRSSSDALCPHPSFRRDQEPNFSLGEDAFYRYSSQQFSSMDIVKDNQVLSSHADENSFFLGKNIQFNIDLNTKAADTPTVTASDISENNVSIFRPVSHLEQNINAESSTNCQALYCNAHKSKGHDVQFSADQNVNTSSSAVSDYLKSSEVNDCTEMTLLSHILSSNAEESDFSLMQYPQESDFSNISHDMYNTYNGTFVGSSKLQGFVGNADTHFMDSDTDTKVLGCNTHGKSFTLTHCTEHGDNVDIASDFKVINFSESGSYSVGTCVLEKGIAKEISYDAEMVTFNESNKNQMRNLARREVSSKQDEIDHENKPINSHKESVTKVMTQESELRYECSKLESKFSSDSNLQCQEIVGNDTSPFTCNICNNHFWSLETLQSHHLTHTLGSMYQKECRECKHHLTHYGAPLQERECAECKSSQNVIVPLRFDFEEKNKKGHAGKEFSNLLKEFVNNKCNICGFVSSSQRPEVGRRHMLVHATERPYKCSECSKAFVSEERLRKHRIVHKNEFPYSCTICDKRFKRSGALKVHQRIHSQDLPHVCDSCDKRFATVMKLNCHSRVHTGERPYCCDICSKTFSFQKNLRLHYSVHTGKKPFLCEFCGKTFTNVTYFRRHKIMHLDGKRYECSFCHKTFNYKTKFSQHMLGHTDKHVCLVCDRTFKFPHHLRQHEQTH